MLIQVDPKEALLQLIKRSKKKRKVKKILSPQIKVHGKVSLEVADDILKKHYTGEIVQPVREELQKIVSKW